LIKLPNSHHLISPLISDERRTTLFYHLRQLLIEEGTQLVDKALIEASSQWNSVIFSGPTNPCSFSCFLDPKAQGKTLSIRSKTSKKGLGAGFILHPEETDLLHLKPLSFSFKDKTLFAVHRDGKEFLTLQIGAEDTPIKVAHYSSGERVTSDIDLVSIAYPLNVDTQPCDPEEPFGKLSQFEKKVLLYANQCFRKLLDIRECENGRSNFNVIHHGPLTRFPKAPLRFVHFPMKVYYPEGRMESFGTEETKQASLNRFFEIHEELCTSGFEMPLPRSWKEENQTIGV
jgi:hypothetical protein